MAEIHACEHIEAITLGPDDHVAVVVPEDSNDDYETISAVLENWWPEASILILQAPYRLVAMAGDDVNTEAVNQ